MLMFSLNLCLVVVVVEGKYFSIHSASFNSSSTIFFISHWKKVHRTIIASDIQLSDRISIALECECRNQVVDTVNHLSTVQHTLMITSKKNHCCCCGCWCSRYTLFDWRKINTYFIGIFGMYASRVVLCVMFNRYNYVASEWERVKYTIQKRFHTKSLFGTEWWWGSRKNSINTSCAVRGLFIIQAQLSEKQVVFIFIMSLLHYLKNLTYFFFDFKKNIFS